MFWTSCSGLHPLTTIVAARVQCLHYPLQGAASTHVLSKQLINSDPGGFHVQNLNILEYSRKIIYFVSFHKILFFEKLGVLPN
jgi:hypothetical protein